MTEAPGRRDAARLRDAAGEIRTPRLRLRRPQNGDLDAVYAVHADPRTNRFNPAGPMRTREEAVETLAEWLAAWRADGIGYWTAVRGGDSRVVGFGGLTFVAWRQRTVLNLYYRLAPEAWGDGLASEIAGAAVELGARELPGVPIVARVRPANAAAIAVARRAGLQRMPHLDTEHAVLAAGWPER